MKVDRDRLFEMVVSCNLRPAEVVHYSGELVSLNQASMWLRANAKNRGLSSAAAAMLLLMCEKKMGVLKPEVDVLYQVTRKRPDPWLSNVVVTRFRGGGKVPVEGFFKKGGKIRFTFRGTVFEAEGVQGNFFKFKYRRREVTAMGNFLDNVGGISFDEEF